MRRHSISRYVTAGSTASSGRAMPSLGVTNSHRVANEVFGPRSIKLTSSVSHEQASKFYAMLTKANRYAFYYRLHNAKKPETKARKIVEFIDMLERGQTFH